MNRRQARGWLLALSLGAGFAAACTSRIELGELGVYDRDAESPEAGPGGEDASSEGAGEAPASSEAGAGEGLPASPPACLSTGCLSTVGTSSAPDQSCVSIRAHASGEENPYEAPEGDHFVYFTTRTPVPLGLALRSLSPIIGNGAILHDMALFEHDGVLPEGVAVDLALDSRMRLVFQWSPGVRSVYLVDGVGIPVEGSYYTLVVRYISQPGFSASLRDTSGIQLCPTTSPAVTLVSFSRLGNENVAGRTAVGTCTPTSDQPIYLLALQPQLNTLDGNAQLLFHRTDGPLDIVYNDHYEFGTTTLATIAPRILQPGESLTAGCNYYAREPPPPGPLAEPEPAALKSDVCLINVLHWPAHTLVSGGRTDACLE